MVLEMNKLFSAREIKNLQIGSLEERIKILHEALQDLSSVIYGKECTLHVLSTFKDSVVVFNEEGLFKRVSFKEVESTINITESVDLKVTLFESTETLLKAEIDYLVETSLKGEVLEAKQLLESILMHKNSVKAKIFE